METDKDRDGVCVQEPTGTEKGAALLIPVQVLPAYLPRRARVSGKTNAELESIKCSDIMGRVNNIRMCVRCLKSPGQDFPH